MRLWQFGVAAALGLVAACVTINVYFPAAEARQAADEVIENVWGQGDDQPKNDEADGRSHLEAIGSAGHRVASAFLDLVIPAANAQGVDIDVTSPGVRRIEASMNARHFDALLPYWNSGAIGLTADAMIEVRDLGSVPLPERNQLRKLVADDNDDRAALYREIARANGHPEWEDRIRATFAERWIAKAARGWYFRDSKGAWARK